MNEETNEVKPDMKRLAEATSVVRFANFSDMNSSHFSALLNIDLSEENVRFRVGWLSLALPDVDGVRAFPRERVGEWVRCDA